MHRAVFITGIAPVFALAGIPAVNLCRERSAAAAAPGRVGICEREARTHHAADVVNLDTVQILSTEHVDEQSHAVLVEDEVALA